jgi:hypothetical protein
MDFWKVSIIVNFTAEFLTKIEQIQFTKFIRTTQLLMKQTSSRMYLIFMIKNTQFINTVKV